MVETKLNSLKEENTVEHKRLFKTLDVLNTNIEEFIGKVNDEFAKKEEVKEVKCELDEYKKNNSAWSRHNIITAIQVITILVMIAVSFKGCTGG